MGFKCGLAGLPNAGKSTLFNAMTNAGVDAAAYPFCTIDPHIGAVALEDVRLDRIQECAKSARKTPTILEFVDIAGLVKGASQGEGLGNQFLLHIGQVDSIAHVVRCFEDENVSHPYESLDPVRDAKIVTCELILKDLEIVEKRLAKSRSSSKSGNTLFKKQIQMLEGMQAHLSGEHELRTFKMDETTLQIVRESNLLTVKPVIFIANVDEAHLKDSPYVKALENHAKSLGCVCISFGGKIQAEIAELPHEEQLEFLQAMGLEETGLQKLVRAGYNALDLVTFFTANENETHAWTVSRGTSVQKAAGKVHTDFETGFIKAEVVHFRDLDQHSSFRVLHDLGLTAVHGRDYVVEDGDLIYYKT